MRLHDITSDYIYTKFDIVVMIYVYLDPWKTTIINKAKQIYVYESME